MDLLLGRGVLNRASAGQTPAKFALPVEEEVSLSVPIRLSQNKNFLTQIAYDLDKP